jgi:hypothetical protein
MDTPPFPPLAFDVTCHQHRAMAAQTFARLVA